MVGGLDKTIYKSKSRFWLSRSKINFLETYLTVKSRVFILSYKTDKINYYEL